MKVGNSIVDVKTATYPESMRVVANIESAIGMSNFKLTGFDASGMYLERLDKPTINRLVALSRISQIVANS
jgi:hypothetical protein